MPKKKRKKDTSSKQDYKPRTVNITPIILKVVGVLCFVYFVYGVWFHHVWGIAPYIFNYTIYILDEDYEEYGLKDDDILIIKRSEDFSEDDLLLERVGTDYKITKGVRRPYGVIVSPDVLGEQLDKIKTYLK